MYITNYQRPDLNSKPTGGLAITMIESRGIICRKKVCSSDI